MSKRKLFVLLNHELLEKQKKELEQRYQIMRRLIVRQKNTKWMAK